MPVGQYPSTGNCAGGGPYVPPDDQLSLDTRVFSREDCATITKRVAQFANGSGGARVRLLCWGNGELRWARNRISVASDRRDVLVQVTRTIRGGSGTAVTNQLDDISLSSAVRAAERLAERWMYAEPKDMRLKHPDLPTPTPALWSDVTANVTEEMRGLWATQSSDGAESQAMMSAGYVETRVAASSSCEWEDRQSGDTIDSTVNQRMQYASLTQAQCSMTVRHPRGIGSGWAGVSGYDWKRIDGPSLARRALEKCLASVDPRRIEPGRYTVVLEPQAVADLLDLLMSKSLPEDPLSRIGAERGIGPFVIGPDATVGLVRTKLGTRIADERVTISHDPMDPRLGVVPEPGLIPVTWIDRGVLTTLNYPREYALANLNENLGAVFRPSYRMSGGTTTIDDMIQSTPRGLLVSRLSNLRVLDDQSLLATGVTRDGLWLIERGKITYAVKNMRMTESPLFALNQIEQLGEPVPIFRPVKFAMVMNLMSAVVPALKVNDFSFTSTVDAV